jgi:hypothetical protein
LTIRKGYKTVSKTGGCTRIFCAYSQIRQEGSCASKEREGREDQQVIDLIRKAENMPLVKHSDQVPSELDVVLMFSPQADAGIEHAHGNLSRKNHLPHDFNQLVF